MSKLPLAVDIADAVNNARRGKSKINVPAASEKLRDAHPEAGATAEDIAGALDATEHEQPSSRFR